MSWARSNMPQVRRIYRVAAMLLGIGAVVMVSGCSMSKFYDTHRPILGDPTRGAGGGRDAPNRGAPYPNLAIVPARPQHKETAADRKKIASELIADQERSAYAAAPLRGGDVQASAPPPPSAVRTASAADTGGSQTASEGTPKPETRRKKPGIWERFFGHRTKTPYDTPEPLPAQPTTPVVVKPADKPLPAVQ